MVQGSLSTTAGRMSSYGKSCWGMGWSGRTPRCESPMSGGARTAVPPLWPPRPVAWAGVQSDWKPKRENLADSSSAWSLGRWVSVIAKKW